MSDASKGTAATTEAPKKRRAPAGPRTPAPLYAFVKVNESGIPSLTASFRDPRKMAAYVATANQNSEHLMVIAPEA